VGDPIYNAADPRWHGPAHTDDAAQLSRLVASGAEVEASARNWAGGAERITLLEGNDASRHRFLGLLAGHPAVIHLATHVVIPADNREQGFVVFGLASAAGGRPPAPEYLSTTDIAGLSVPGALVVMSGCSTGTGNVVGGAGLLGLTRAWLMAGAGAVVATAWPEEDTSGEIFGRFYHYLQNDTAAEALRRSQVEAAHSASWRAAPAYWASYQITGGAR
jgi:CHAT domain-containing protein